MFISRHRLICVYMYLYIDTCIHIVTIQDM